jgi:hypothetical protein
MAKAKDTELNQETLAQLAAHVAQRLESEKQDANTKAEELLREAVAEDREFELEERQWFWQALRWDDKELARQKTRITRVMREQAIAGTADDRESLAAEAEDSARVLKEHGQQLEEEIRTKQAALRLLQDSAAQSAKRVEQAKEACQRLTTLLPPPIADEINMVKKHSARSYKERLHFLETEISYRRQMMAGCPTDQQQADHWYNSLKRIHPELVRGRVNGDGQRGLGYQLNESVWEQVKAKWQAEIAEWEPEVADLRESVAGAEADIAVLAQHYWR